MENIEQSLEVLRVSSSKDVEAAEVDSKEAHRMMLYDSFMSGNSTLPFLTPHDFGFPLDKLAVQIYQKVVMLLKQDQNKQKELRLRVQFGSLAYGDTTFYSIHKICLPYVCLGFKHVDMFLNAQRKLEPSVRFNWISTCNHAVKFRGVDLRIAQFDDCEPPCGFSNVEEGRFLNAMQYCAIEKELIAKLKACLVLLSQ